MMAFWDIFLNEQFWAATIRISTPLIFGVLGALIGERSGVLNLGIEGIFVAGAMAGWLAVFLGSGLWTGVLVAACTGMFIGLVHGVLTVPLGLSQHVCGIAITLLATSASYFIYRTVLPTTSSPPKIEPFSIVAIPFLSELPWIGVAFFQQTPLTWLALFLVIIVWYVLKKTVFGVVLYAAGDNPDALDSQGLSVYSIRIGAIALGSALMAIGGAFLTISAFDAFFFGMIGGRGWVCIALVVFASWQPHKALFGSLLFGAFDAYQIRLQTQVGAYIPSQVFLMMPYILSIVMLIVVARGADYPKSLLTPWFKGQR